MADMETKLNWLEEQLELLLAAVQDMKAELTRLDVQRPPGKPSEFSRPWVKGMPI